MALTREKLRIVNGAPIGLPDRPRRPVDLPDVYETARPQHLGDQAMSLRAVLATMIYAAVMVAIGAAVGAGLMYGVSRQVAGATAPIIGQAGGDLAGAGCCSDTLERTP